MPPRSKLLTAAAAAITAATAAAVGWRTGARRLTVLVNGAPAAGAKLERMGPHGMETLRLDEQGSLDLAWGFTERHPLVWFRAGEDRNVELRLPSFGQRDPAFSRPGVVGPWPSPHRRCGCWINIAVQRFPVGSARGQWL